MTIEKKIMIAELLLEIDDILISQFFDISSEEMPDEKIEVLTALKQGKKPIQIEKYYDILELYPKNTSCVCTHWD